MGNKDESKRHYIADEGLGGVEREYVEIDRKADVGDYVFISRYSGESVNRIGRLDTEGIKEGSFSFEDIVGNSCGGFYLTKGRGDEFYPLSPTDIIRHNGERYRLVSDRKAKVCDKVIVTATNLGNMRDVKIGGVYETITRDLDGSPVVNDDALDKAAMQYGNFHVLEPVSDECSDKTEGDQSIKQQYREYADRKAIAESQPDSTPDLIDLVIRLTRKVAELEKTSNNADYKAGQALTTAELQADKMEMLTDDIITLDERTQTCDCTCRRCCR